jgi:uncharacterized membrane protein
VIDVRLPDVGVIHGDAELLAALAQLWPRVATYLMSFLTLGLFWMAQQTQHNMMARADRNVAWLHLIFLALIGFVPVSTRLLTHFADCRVAMIVYWLNFVMVGFSFLAAWNYAVRAGLLKPEVDRDMIAAVNRRVLVRQISFTAAAALSAFGTTWSLGFLVLVQLNYAFAPWTPWMRWLPPSPGMTSR